MCKHPADGRRAANRQVSIGNTDMDIIVACVACLMELGIPYWIHSRENAERPEWKPLTQVFITRKEGFEMIRELVPIQSSAKLAKLDQILASYHPNPNYRRRFVKEAA